MYRIKVGTEARNNLYGWANTVDEAHKIVHDYVQKSEVNGFKSYYLNCSMFPEERLIRIDYGKWSDFIYVHCDTTEEFNAYVNGK